MTDLLKLTQWLSPAFPVGSFAYSHGVEQAIVQGDIADAEGLRTWLCAILRFGSGRTDAILLAEALRGERDLAELADTAEALSASRERWIETRDQGRAFLSTTNALFAEDLPEMAYPVAVGRVARDLDMLPADIIAVFLHAFTSNIVSCAVRFIPLGQTEGQRVLDQLHDTISQVARAAAEAGVEDIANAAIGSDLSAMEHERLQSRIFRT
ncbi:MAG: urease accessory protein UreF [Paracoccaceae bacterium]